MESAEQLPDFEELLSLYGKEKADFAEAAEVSDFEFGLERGEVQKRMNEVAASPYDSFIAAKEDDPDTVIAKETEYAVRRYKNLGEVVIDDSIPVVMSISKFFFEHKEENYKEECIDFTLHRKDTSPPEEIAVIRMKDGGDNFDVLHREVSPQYRGKGIGTLLLNAGERFVKTAAEGRGDQKLIAKIGQLDVLFWMWKRGYRPDKKEDELMLQRVLNADGLKVLDRYFVFEDSVNDDDLYFEGFEKIPEYMDYHNAISITMSKKIEMGDSAEVGQVQKVTSGQISESF